MRSTQRKQSRKVPTTAHTSRPAPSRDFPQANQMRLPQSSADLRRRFQDLERSQKDLVDQENIIWGELELLTVSLGISGQYWIALKGTGKSFIRQPFA